MKKEYKDLKQMYLTPICFYRCLATKIVSHQIRQKTFNLNSTLVIHFMNGPILHIVTSFLLGSFIKENICIFQIRKHAFELVFVINKNCYKRKGGRNFKFKYFNNF